MEEKENNHKSSEVQSLFIEYAEEKKEEETFESKMDSLFNQLDEQFEKVKKYANFDIPLDQIELNQYKFKYNFENDKGNNIYNNKENLIEININNENKDNKDNNDNQDEIILKNKKVEIKEIKDDEEIKKKMYDEMAYQRMEEERKIKEMELEKKREKNLEEEKRIKEQQQKREEELIQREKEILKREEDLKKKEKDLERKREEEEKRILEEKRRREEEEEALERSRMLKEEEEKLKKIEEEKEKEEQRESDRIKKLRIEKEKEEEKKKKMKQLEDEKKKEMEKKEKEKQIIEQKKLIDQINSNKINNNKAKKSVEETNNEINEIDIEEINSDEDIEELEVNDNNNKQSNNKNTIKSNIKSINSELTNNTKLKSINKGNISNSRFNNKSINNLNNKSRNKNISPTKKSQIKESSNKSMKKPKEEKKPEDSLFKDKKPEKERNKEDGEFYQKFKKSKVYSQISQEIIDKLLEHIYAIDDFDEQNSEIEDINIYPSITEFNKEDKNLKEMIPDFEEKILKNEKLNVDDRYRKYYSKEEAFDKNQENDKVNELLFEIMNISNESHTDILQKKFEKEKLKNLPTTEFEELNDIEELENKLFGKEDIYPESYPIISNLENLRTFIYKFKPTAKENPNIMVNAIQSFNYWRSSLNDGNSFYRVIMYSLLEHCILNKDCQFLMLLINEISSDDFIEYYKKRNIEYNKPFMILSAISIMLENKLEIKALEYLLKAYNLKNGYFDMLLIIYLKKVLCDFGKEINKLLDEKKKSEENLDLIEETKINIEQIEALYLDPPKINIFNLISELFNINIQLFLLGGKYMEPINSLTNIEKDDSSRTFIFGYFFSGYHILYSPDFDENNDIFKNVAENYNPELCKLTTELKEQKKCDICFKETDHIAFLQKKYIVCFSCLTNYLKESIKKRTEYFFDDKCLGQEYYSRPFNLQDQFYLDDFDLGELSDEGNIINNLYLSKKENKCILCDKLKEDDVKLLILPCKCSICDECFNKLFMKITNNHGYLLPCEVGMLNNKFQCNCGKLFDYNDISYLYKPTQEQKDKAKDRLSFYKDNYCLICLTNLLNEEDVKKVKIKKEKEDDVEHFICLKCYCKYFKNLYFDSDDDDDNTKEENEEVETKSGKDTRGDKDTKNTKNTKGTKGTKTDKEVKVIKDEHKIKCSICQRWHHYIGSVDGCGCVTF